MKDTHVMTTDTEAYQSEIKKLVETDPKARRIYVEMKAELSAARQLREMHKSDGLVERADAKGTHKTK